MDRSSLHQAFQLLGETLTAANTTPIWLVVGGGSALLMLELGNRQTKDVDVMALREWEGNIVDAYPLPNSLKQAAQAVAHELSLPKNWLNSSASLHGFDFARLPEKFWQSIDTHDYGSLLKISFIGRPGLILLKLAAALNREQQRDIEDLKTLAPTQEELRESLSWVLETFFDSTNHPKLPALLHKIGHEQLISEYS